MTKKEKKDLREKFENDPKWANKTNALYLLILAYGAQGSGINKGYSLNKYKAEEILKNYSKESKTEPYIVREQISPNTSYYLKTSIIDVAKMLRSRAEIRVPSETKNRK